MYGSAWCWDFYNFKMSDYGDLFFSFLSVLVWFRTEDHRDMGPSASNAVHLILCSTKNRIQIGFEFEKRQIFEIRGCEFSGIVKFG